ncbi:MAG: hypothetical protein V3R49_03695 [Gammaproteobacteria bacterium]
MRKKFCEGGDLTVDCIRRGSQSLCKFVEYQGIAVLVNGFPVL